jgi:hypothetical protein
MIKPAESVLEIERGLYESKFCNLAPHYIAAAIFDPGVGGHHPPFISMQKSAPQNSRNILPAPTKSLSKRRCHDWCVLVSTSLKGSIPQFLSVKRGRCRQQWIADGE